MSYISLLIVLSLVYIAYLNKPKNQPILYVDRDSPEDYIKEATHADIESSNPRDDRITYYRLTADTVEYYCYHLTQWVKSSIDKTNMHMYDIHKVKHV